MITLKPQLLYDKGTLVIKDLGRVPYAIRDERINAYRAEAMYYTEICEYLKKSKISFEDNVVNSQPIQDIKFAQSFSLKIRDYQKKAISAWEDCNHRGTVILPTGSGKTIVALCAIEKLQVSTLIIVPTLDLVDQWKKVIENAFGLKPGIIGGGKHIIEGITICTYDSAFIKAAVLGNRFKFVIFDEVHHLPSPGYAQIAEMFASPYRLGLTATYKREDGLHRELDRLIGRVVYSQNVNDLAGTYLSNYRLEKILTDLTEDERENYEKEQSTFRNYLKKHKIQLRKPADFQKLVMRSGRDPEARTALLARNKARQIALNSTAKLNILANLLKQHYGDRTIIFTQYNELVNSISKKFLIPAITHKTKPDERKNVLEFFHNGNYSTVVTSKVLDEGVDVPEASVGIILSGTGSSREFIQRLGRLLRKREGKHAKLYEIVSKDTSEINTSSKRKNTFNQNQKSS